MMHEIGTNTSNKSPSISEEREPTIRGQSTRRCSSTARRNKKSLTRRRKSPTRQKNVVQQKIATLVSCDFESVKQSSRLLKKNVPIHLRNRTAVFHRSEILTKAECAGEGGFSEVYEVTGFNLSDQVSKALSPVQQALRKNYADTAIDPSTGRGRFVIKQLKNQLLDRKRKIDFIMAATDLAVEAAYMSRLDHPHILPLRGLPFNGVKALESGRHDGYFLLLDRLDETLDQRMEKWKQTKGEAKDCNLLFARTEYACQLASAVAHLHELRIVFRDLKPENIGFNKDGNLQLFDFGLCRELPSEDTNEVYEMSGSGTRRYMAPEIVNDARYNLKVDVYSWAIVTWQMFSLSQPYGDLSREEHKLLVCEQGERPALESNCYYVPHTFHKLLEASWCQSVSNRIDMDQVVSRLKPILAEHRRMKNLGLSFADQRSRALLGRTTPSPLATLQRSPSSQHRRPTVTEVERDSVSTSNTTEYSRSYGRSATGHSKACLLQLQLDGLEELDASDEEELQVVKIGLPPMARCH